jgi:hypothetical protein
LFVFQAHGFTNVGKVIVDKQIWTAAGSPYVLTDNSAILNGASVTVMPGVEIRAAVASVTYNFDIHGNFVCLGKADSMIAINGVALKFNPGCPDYNLQDQSGIKMLYTSFRATQTGSYIISDIKADFLMDHCLFDGYYYGISGSDSTRLYIRNSKFIGFAYSYAITGQGAGSYLEFTDNSLINLGYIYLAEKSIFKNNYLSGMGSGYGISAYYAVKTALIECNIIKKMQYAFYGANFSTNFKSMKIANNKFDSCSNFMYVTFPLSTQPDSFVVTNNSFTHNLNPTNVFYFNTSFTNNLKQLNLTGNYWGTSDTVKIKSFIRDNRTLSTVQVKVNFGGYLNAEGTACWPATLSNLASVNNFKKPVIDFNLGPNPMENILYLTLHSVNSYKAEIQDLNGKKLYQWNIDTKYSNIDLKNLNCGVYIVRISDAFGNQVSKKIVKL